VKAGKCGRRGSGGDADGCRFAGNWFMIRPLLSSRSKIDQGRVQHLHYLHSKHGYLETNLKLNVNFADISYKQFYIIYKFQTSGPHKMRFDMPVLDYPSTFWIDKTRRPYQKMKTLLHVALTRADRQLSERSQWQH
jgi:hypothetical protein